MMKNGSRPLFMILIVIFSFVLAAPAVKNNMDDRVDAVVTRITPALVEIRRDIHCHPELSME
jgi:hypothetical protein